MTETYPDLLVDKRHLRFAVVVISLQVAGKTGMDECCSSRFTFFIRITTQFSIKRVLLDAAELLTPETMFYLRHQQQKQHPHQSLHSSRRSPVRAVSTKIKPAAKNQKGHSPAGLERQVRMPHEPMPKPVARPHTITAQPNNPAEKHYYWSSISRSGIYVLVARFSLNLSFR